MASGRWHWVSEDGVHHEVSEEELIAGLSSEHIPVYALVWREGWGEWLPAMQIAELSWALPAGRADVSLKPVMGPGRPAPNLSAYPQLRQRAAQIREQGGTQPNADPLLRPRPPAPKSTRRMEAPSAPSLALPKPPLGKNAPDRGWAQPENEDATVVERPMRGPPPQAYSAVKVERPREGVAPVKVKPFWRHRLLIGAAIGAALIAWLIAVVLPSQQPILRSTWRKALGKSQPSPSPTATATALDEPPPRESLPAPVCKVRRGRQLAEWVYPAVRPAFAKLPTGNVAVGYAQTNFYAIGINVNLKTLDREFAFREYQKQSLFSVVPSHEKDQLVFATPRSPSDIIHATAVVGSIRTIIGQGQGGVAQRVGNGPIKRLWPLPPRGRPIAVPSVAVLPSGSTAIALRAGGERGSIHVGIVDPQGKPSAGLAALESGAEAFGEPSVAVRDKTTVVVFAGRKPNEANWNIFVASGQEEAPPTSAKPLALGTPNNTATFIAALGDHHFMLLWADQSALENVTKFVVLDEEFRVLGSPSEISTETQHSAGAGLWASGSDALAAYLVTEGSNTEMWGAYLKCTF